jgi:hypothetical protein
MQTAPVSIYTRLRRSCRALLLGSRHNLKRVADLDLGRTNGSRRELDHASQPRTHRRNPKRRKRMPQLDDFKIAIQANDIDAETHKESMDARRGLDPKTSSGVQPLTSEQATHSRKRGVGQLNAVSYQCSPGYIRDFEHKKHSTGLCILLLAAINNDSEHSSGKSSSDTLNYMGGKHCGSSFPLNSIPAISHLHSADRTLLPAAVACLRPGTLSINQRQYSELRLYGDLLPLIQLMPGVPSIT